MNIQEVIGIVAVVIYFIGAIPYFLDTFRGETRPNRVTWFGWALLSWTPALIQSAHGADTSVMILYAVAIVTTSIFILSLYRGVTIFSITDAVSLSLGIFAYIFWLVLDTPVFALIMNIIADALFAIPTIVKVWRMPKSESQRSWSIGAFSLGLTFLSKTNFDFINTAFLIYLLFLNTSVFVFTTGFFQKIKQSNFQKETK